MNQRTADRFVELRKHFGYSQEELADAIGVSRQAVSKWERGESSPDTDNLIELARLYHISLDELVNGDAIPEKNIEDVKVEEAKSEGKASEENDFVWEDDGARVEIKDKTILVKNEQGEEKVYERDAVEKKRLKTNRRSAFAGGCFALLASIAYLILGFTLKSGNGWVCAWPLFILIPVVASVVVCVSYKRVAAFCYPALIAAIYCFLGVTYGFWHPHWILFLTIPIFYLVAGFIDRATRSHDYEAIDNAYDKKEGRHR